MRGTKILIALLVLAGCEGTYEPEQKETGRGGVISEPIPIEEMFVSEEIGEGLVRTVFETNKEQYWAPEGQTVWTVWGEEGAAYNSRAVTMAKPDGYSGGGYGIVFCQGEYEVNGVLQSAMLVVMVNNEGNYIIGKAVGGIFTDFGWWKGTPHLKRGAGAENEVAVTYEEWSGEYRLDINGSSIERFRDEEEPALSGGKNGYIVVITPFDHFPQSGVTVYFTEGR